MTDTVNAEQPQGIADSVTDTASAAAAFGKMGLFNATQQPNGTEAASPEQSQADTGGADEPPPEQTTDEPTGEDGGQQAEAQTEYFTVKIDGKEERVTRDELLAGYQKDKDYRLKTAKLAEERKALEQEREHLKAVQAERQHLAQMLGSVIPSIEKQISDKFGKVDWVQLARDNPAEWASMRAEFDAHQQQLMFAQQEKSRVERQQAEDFQRSHAKFLEAETAKLVEKIPEFADPEKGPKFKAEMKAFLKDAGFNDQEIGGIADHRSVLIARDAMLYRAAKKATATAAQAAKTAPQVQRPGASPRTDVRAEIQKSAMAKLAKTGRIEDAAAAFRTMKIFG